MAKEWFYAVGKDKQGPITSEELKSLVASGTIRPDTFLWHSGMKEWQRASKIRGLFPDQPQVSPPAIPRVTPPPLPLATSNKNQKDDDEEDDEADRILANLRFSNRVTPNDILCLECGYNGKMADLSYRGLYSYVVMLSSPIWCIISFFVFAALVGHIFALILVLFSLFGCFSAGKITKYKCPNCERELDPK